MLNVRVNKNELEKSFSLMGAEYKALVVKLFMSVGDSARNVEINEALLEEDILWENDDCVQKLLSASEIKQVNLTKINIWEFKFIFFKLKFSTLNY